MVEIVNLETHSIEKDFLDLEIIDIELGRRERNKENQEKKRQNRYDTCVENTEDFCKEVSKLSQLLFLENCETSPLGISDNTLKYILDNDLADPQFTILTGKQRGKILRKLGLQQKLDPESLLLVFRLPKLLTISQLEDEERELFPELRNFKEENGGEWGYLYRSLIQILWKEIEEYQEKGLSFRRLNSKGQHHPTNYYYILEVQRNKYLKHLTIPNNNQRPS